MPSFETNNLFINDLEFQHVPASAELRRKIRDAVDTIDETRPRSLSRKDLETLAKELAPEPQSIAWIMVLIGSRLWRRRVLNIPYRKRLLLLPHCMRNSKLCQAEYNAQGLQCLHCGACPLGELKAEAESLGYTVMIAEGSPVVMQWILSGRADAILGVGCLRSLERAFDKLTLAGIPAMAVPLLQSLCKDSETELDEVRKMIQTPWSPAPDHQIPSPEEPQWIHLLREAGKLFDDSDTFSESEPSHPMEMTRHISMDFLRRGGKYYRPFITLATFDALTGASCVGSDGALWSQRIPQWVKQAASAVEVFHKASLVHDDIEDADTFRYGMPTIHARWGDPIAVNIGDYLIGYGYRLIAELKDKIPEPPLVKSAEIVSEMIAALTDAHLRLCRGQGAELAWKQNESLPSAEDVLKVYALKTAPAFEVALSIGILAALAVKTETLDFYRNRLPALARLARHLGVAFQISNDLDDLLPDGNNKRIAGRDLIENRPTIIKALAGYGLRDQQMSPNELIAQYRKDGILEKTRILAEKYIQRARSVVEEMEIEDPNFKRLLFHFIDTIAKS